MQRFAEFVVRRRKLVFAIFAALAVLSVLLMPLVRVNKDMTSYLPEDSGVKAGLAVMNAEFGETTPLEVMTDGLAHEAQQAFADGLAALEGVSSVQYEADETDGEYHNGSLTRFVVNLSGGAYSQEAADTLARVRAYAADEGLSGDDLAIAGSVVDNQDLNSSLAVTFGLAIAIGIGILFVMCSSWVEPLLFLTAIGLAIVINMGTNAFFDCVANITFSIAAVLQLALSMDYSIMLMERYRQERASQPDPACAMEAALAGGFAPIASSSVTTIAGMACLVFMSFTIGRDMGLVLGKGVLLSLLCVLFVLPGLVVTFDKAIERTHKRRPSPKLAGLARAGYKARLGVLGAFCVLLAVSFVAKGTAGINYFMTSSNPDQARIEEAFPPASQVVVVYPNADEQKAAQAAQQVEQLEGVRRVQSYATTIGPTLTAQETAEKMGMDARVTRMLFYDYFQNVQAKKLSLHELAQFLADELASGALDELGGQDQLAGVDTAQLARLAAVTSPDALAGTHDAASMAQLLGMSEEQVAQLYQLWYLRHGDVSGVRMTPEEFLGFTLDALAATPEYAGAFTNEQLAQMEAARAQAQAMPLSVGYAQMAGLTGASEEQVRQVYAARELMEGRADVRLGVCDFLAFLTDDLAQDPEYAQLLDAGTLGSLQALRSAAQEAQAGTRYTSAEMTGVLSGLAGAGTSLDESEVTLAYLLFLSENAYLPEWELPFDVFVRFVADEVVGSPTFAGLIDSDAGEKVRDAADTLDESRENFVGETHSRIIVTVDGSRESTQMQEALPRLRATLDDAGVRYQLVGDAAMADEMRASFADELNFITLLTAVVMIAIVAVTFRSLVVPVILVAFIQCSINVTMGVAALQGVSTYYLALIIVQAILMGAAIDYAILFTSYYRDLRRSMRPRDAIVSSYAGALPTILTSGSILVLVTLVVGLTSTDVTTAEVCLTIARGSFTAVLLVVALLPGVLAALDRFVAGPGALPARKQQDAPGGKAQG